MTTPQPALATPSIPAIMTRPHLLAPDEPWTHRCRILMHGRDTRGHERSLYCGVETQGGRAGLAAHVAVVHGSTP